MFNEKEFVLKIIKDQISNRCEDWQFGERPSTYESAMDLFWDSCFDKGNLVFGKIVMPDIRWFYGWRGWPIIYGDSIMTHHLLNDNYTMENCNAIEWVGGEGTYFIEDIIPKPKDVVIDAGAYIGDFAAAASVLGADVYAFEPSPRNLPILHHTSLLNGFRVVECGLSNETKTETLYLGSNGNIDTMQRSQLQGTDVGAISCNVCTLDDFSKNNNLHINFIKSDIEGFERNLLRGATHVLQEQEPDLAIRIYHNQGEDKTVIPQMIQDINPRYKMKFGIHKMTCYATTRR